MRPADKGLSVNFNDLVITAAAAAAAAARRCPTTSTHDLLSSDELVWLLHKVNVYGSRSQIHYVLDDIDAVIFSSDSKIS